MVNFPASELEQAAKSLAYYIASAEPYQRPATVSEAALDETLRRLIVPDSTYTPPLTAAMSQVFQESTGPNTSVAFLFGHTQKLAEPAITFLWRRSVEERYIWVVYRIEAPLVIGQPRLLSPDPRRSTES